METVFENFRAFVKDTFATYTTRIKSQKLSTIASVPDRYTAFTEALKELQPSLVGEANNILQSYPELKDRLAEIVKEEHDEFMKSIK